MSYVRVFVGECIASLFALNSDLRYICHLFFFLQHTILRLIVCNFVIYYFLLGLAERVHDI